MKKTIMAGMVSLAAVTLMCGCDDFGETRGKGQGRIMPLIGLDSQTLGAGRVVSPDSRADGSVGVNDLSVTLETTAGDYKKTWESVDAFVKDCETERFSIGEYLLSVWYGDQKSTGFDVPAYYGSATLTVKDDQATEVGVSASMSKSMFSIAYTDAFQKYMSDWSVEIGGVTIASDETRPAYVLPGEVAVKMSFTTVGGQTATTTVATVNAQARHHYKVTVDVNGGEVNDAALKVDWDETLETENVEIKLEGLFSSEPPAITADGFVAGEAVSFVEGFAPETPLKLNIVAMGGLKSVLLETSSHGLNGWPASVELLGADAATQQLLTGKGLAALGLWRNPGQMAQIDFAGVLKNIKTSPEGNTSEFTVTVTDNYGRTGSMALTVEAEGLVLNLDPAGEAFYMPGEPVALTMEYNGPDPKANIELTYMASSAGRPRPVADWTVEPLGRAAGFYKVTMNGFTSTGNIELTAKCNGYSTSTTIKAPRYVVSADDNNVFAKYAYVSVFDNETNAPADLSTLTFGATVNGADIAIGGAVEGNYYKVTGLTPGQVNNIRVVSDERSTVAAVRAEAATQLPDSDMDFWDYEKKGDYQYLWTVGSENAWNTLNPLTISTYGSGSGNGLNTGGCSYKATSGTIPANSRSTQSTATGGAIGTTKHSDGHTEGNATLHSDKQYSGSNAALIRTVGWGSGNTASSATSGQRFGTCQNKTPGELYLGAYQNGAPVYGHGFTSRPSALTFFYRYDVVSSGNGDYGTAEVSVYDESGTVISSGRIELGEQSEYTEVSIPLVYSVNAGKAAKISVIFKSSGNEAAMSASTTYWRCPGVKNTSGGEYVGSELYIDDIELIY